MATHVLSVVQNIIIESRRIVWKKNVMAFYIIMKCLPEFLLSLVRLATDAIINGTKKRI
jgi:hypothetical protein